MLVTLLGALISLCSVFESFSQEMVERNISPSTFKQKFAQTLLIVHFNHPHYDNIPFLKELYSPYFPNIAFYGEKAHPQVTQVYTHYGFMFSRVMIDAMIRYPQYSGYLFLQDDCILNVWNYSNHDLNKIWFAVQFNMQPNFTGFMKVDKLPPHPIQVNVESWPHWSNAWGIVPARKAYHQLNAKELAYLERNVGAKNAITAIICDMLYVPGRLRQQTIRLSELFRDTFCEISVPTLLCCLDLITNWEQLAMCWDMQQTVTTHYPSHFSWIHPIKLSKSSNRTFLLNVFRQHFPRVALAAI